LLTNRHLTVRNKLRLDQLVIREGGIDNYIRYVEELIRREHEKRRNSQSSHRNSGAKPKKSKKKVVLRLAGEEPPQTLGMKTRRSKSPAFTGTSKPVADQLQ